MPRKIARPSVASLPLQLRFQGRPLSTATGFVVEHGDRAFLVTNWHVVTGRNPNTGAPISGSAAVPDEVVIRHNKAGAAGGWVALGESLLDAEGHPRWLEHPAHGRAVDVVAVGLTQLAGVQLYSYNPWNPGPGIAIGVAAGLSIVGFPFGLTGGGLGVWVQGTIATEPDLDFEQLPRFLIDSRTRPGQSGSPVIAYRSGGTVAMADGSTVVYNGPVEQLVGVYSGRINAESDLGFAWRVEAVRDVIEAGQAAAA